MKKWIFLSVGLLLFAGLIAYTSTVRLTKNFYEVDAGKFYRSAQLTPDEMQQAINQYAIKTVISLRGGSEESYWYKPQVEVLARNKVEFYPISLSMDSFPSKENLNEIIRLLKTAPKPILVHCRSGADRTGMVSALYQIEEMGKSKEEALEQLRFKYWYVEAFHPAMTEFIKVYQGSDWAQNSYQPCSYKKFKNDLPECRSF